MARFESWLGENQSSSLRKRDYHPNWQQICLVDRLTGETYRFDADSTLLASTITTSGIFRPSAFFFSARAKTSLMAFSSRIRAKSNRQTLELLRFFDMRPTASRIHVGETDCLIS